MSSQCLPNVYPMPPKCPICLPNIPKFGPLSFPVKSRISSDMFWLKIDYMLKKDRLTAYWTGAYIWYIGEPFWTRAEESCLFTQSFWKTRPAPTRWNVNMMFTRVIKMSQFEDNTQSSTTTQYSYLSNKRTCQCLSSPYVSFSFFMTSHQISLFYSQSIKKSRLKIGDFGPPPALAVFFIK
jgi:hypothetical protein